MTGGNKPLVGGRGSLLGEGIFPGGGMSKFSASGGTPPIPPVGKTLLSERGGNFLTCFRKRGYPERGRGVPSENGCSNPRGNYVKTSYSKFSRLLKTRRTLTFTTNSFHRLDSLIYLLYLKLVLSNQIGQEVIRTHVMCMNEVALATKNQTSKQPPPGEK